MKQRTVIFLSDRTGITAESLGLSLISQFEGVQFNPITLPFIDSIEKAHEASNRINHIYAQEGIKPIIFATIVNPEVRAPLEQSQAYFIDFFKSFIPSLENELKIKASNLLGRSHGVGDEEIYNTRIEAVNFALNYDDGARITEYHSADIVLVGVSRCGKTPTCLYLAMQYGIRAANYPLTEEDMGNHQLPKILQPYRDKLFGLTIDPQRLHIIRAERKPNSRYASLTQCQHEVRVVERLFEQEKIPYLSSTNLSIEELSAKLIVMGGLKRRFR